MQKHRPVNLQFATKKSSKFRRICLKHPMSRHSKFKAVTNERNQCCGIPTRFPDGKNDPHYISSHALECRRSRPLHHWWCSAGSYVSRNCGEFQWHMRRTFSLTDHHECVFRHLSLSLNRSFFFQQKRRIVKLYFVISKNSSATFFYLLLLKKNINLIE